MKVLRRLFLLEPDLRLNEWLGFAIWMPVVFGVSFQTPLVMLFMERIGLFSVEASGTTQIGRAHV